MRYPIEAAEVHLWRLDLARERDAFAAHLPILSPAERERCARFVFEAHRRDFAATHAWVRRVLCRYVDEEPAELEFEYGPHDKPRLAAYSGGAGLGFNLSHSGEIAVLGVAAGREIGVDVEEIRSGVAARSIARRFFSPREMAELEAVAPERRLEAFFDCWTRKEAYIKARGEGLSYPLRAFSVSIAPGEPAALIEDARDPSKVMRWYLCALHPGDGYTGALAVRGRRPTFRYFDWVAARDQRTSLADAA